MQRDNHFSYPVRFTALFGSLAAAADQQRRADTTPWSFCTRNMPLPPFWVALKGKNIYAKKLRKALADFARDRL